MQPQEGVKQLEELRLLKSSQDTSEGHAVHTGPETMQPGARAGQGQGWGALQLSHVAADEQTCGVLRLLSRQQAQHELWVSEHVCLKRTTS